MKTIKNVLKSAFLGLSIVWIQLITSANVFATTVTNTITTEEAFKKLADKMAGITTGVTLVLTAVMTLVFVWKAFQFARTGDNPSERAKAINGMIFFFIGAACFGTASAITMFLTGLNLLG